LIRFVFSAMRARATYVVAEGGNLGAPDRAKAEVFGKKRVLDGSGPGRQAYERALEPKRLVMLPGGHFDAYVRDFAASSAAACQWFREHLLTTGSA